MQWREEYTQRQIKLFQSLVQGMQLQQRNGQTDVKVQKLTENDDIVVYTFEKLMVTYEVKAEHWVFKVATNLVGI